MVYFGSYGIFDVKFEISGPENPRIPNLVEIEANLTERCAMCMESNCVDKLNSESGTKNTYCM